MGLNSPPIPLALYLHFPRCLSKCPYCDFHSSVLQRDDVEEYVKSIKQEINYWRPYVGGRQLESIYLGGGTPSLMPIAALEQVFNLLRGNFSWLAEIEVSLEANPRTFNLTTLRDYRALGFNRLSVGVQTFDDQMLALLQRRYQQTEVRMAINWVREAGFDNFNLDLMYGLPGQNLELALKDLEFLTLIRPPHLSWYQLTLGDRQKKNWNLASTLPDTEVIWKIEQQGKKYLKQELGLKNYEISSYAKHKKFQCRHNLNYWHYGDYLALGAGAHGKLTFNTGKVWRYFNYPRAWVKNRPCTGEFLDKRALILEFIINVTRLATAISFKLFTERTGLSIEQIRDKLVQGEERGWLKVREDHFQVTAQGKRFLDNLLELFA